MANLATIADHRRMRIERIVKRLLRREFARFAREAAENPRSLALPIEKHRERLAQILATGYSAVIPMGVELTEDQLLKSLKQIQTTEALIQNLLFDWMENISFVRAGSISEGSREVVRAALYESIDEGLGEAATAKKIREAVEGLSRARSLTIARTETHGAMINAGTEAARDLGAMEKTWVAIEDSRTRETHVQADGQTVGMKELYNVGGASLRFPGDPSAGAPGETINCRCAQAFS